MRNHRYPHKKKVSGDTKETHTASFSFTPKNNTAREAHGTLKHSCCLLHYTATATNNNTARRAHETQTFLLLFLPQPLLPKTTLREKYMEHKHSCCFLYLSLHYYQKNYLGDIWSGFPDTQFPCSSLTSHFSPTNNFEIKLTWIKGGTTVSNNCTFKIRSLTCGTN